MDLIDIGICILAGVLVAAIVYSRFTGMNTYVFLLPNGTFVEVEAEVIEMLRSCPPDEVPPFAIVLNPVAEGAERGSSGASLVPYKAPAAKKTVKK